MRDQKEPKENENYSSFFKIRNQVYGFFRPYNNMVGKPHFSQIFFCFNVAYKTSGLTGT